MLTDEFVGAREVLLELGLGEGHGVHALFKMNEPAKEVAPLRVGQLFADLAALRAPERRSDGANLRRMAESKAFDPYLSVSSSALIRIDGGA